MYHEILALMLASEEPIQPNAPEGCMDALLQHSTTTLAERDYFSLFKCIGCVSKRRSLCCVSSKRNGFAISVRMLGVDINFAFTTHKLNEWQKLYQALGSAIWHHLPTTFILYPYLVGGLCEYPSLEARMSVYWSDVIGLNFALSMAQLVFWRYDTK